MLDNVGVIPPIISKTKANMNGKKNKYFNEVDSNIWQISLRDLADKNIKIFDRMIRVDCIKCGGVLNYGSKENV
jgi:hypothetical protein